MFTVIKLIGGVYLAYLGLRQWRAAWLNLALRHRQTTVAPTVGTSITNTQIFKKALTVSLLNPKGLLFSPTMMVQFIRPDYQTSLLSFFGAGADFSGHQLAVFEPNHSDGIGIDAVFWQVASMAHVAVGALFLGFALRLVLA